MAADPRRMCPHCRAFITTKDRTCPYCNEAVAPRQAREAATGVLAGFIPQARYNTTLILLINAGLFMATAIYSTKSGQGNLLDIDGLTLLNFGAKYTPVIALGQWWRLVTAGFLHGGLLHIAMNSWAMFDLGAQVDELYGTSRMLVIYFISSVCGFFASAIWSPVLSVGASAALCGLIGAMIAVGMKSRSVYGAMIRQVYIRWLVWILIFSLLPRVDMAAHVGGLVGGFLVAWIAGAGERRYASPWTERLWRLAAVFCLVLTGASFLKMYLSFGMFGP